MSYLNVFKRLSLEILFWFASIFAKIFSYLLCIAFLLYISLRVFFVSTEMGQKFSFHLNRSLGIMHYKTLNASYEEITNLYRNKLGVKYEFEGLENVPKEGPVIVFANHAGAHEQEFICDELNKKVRKGTKYFTYLSNKTPRALGVVMLEADRERIIPGGREIVAQHINEGNIMVIFPVGKVENKPYWVRYDHYKEQFKRLALENKYKKSKCTYNIEYV